MSRSIEEHERSRRGGEINKTKGRVGSNSTDVVTNPGVDRGNLNLPVATPALHLPIRYRGQTDMSVGR
jgi:hypothetical protein